MSTIRHKTDTEITANSPFSSADSLALVQGFHKEIDIKGVLLQILGAAKSHTPTEHLHYHYPEHDLTIELGEAGVHSASYGLQFSNARGGELRFTARRRFDEADLEVLENLMTLAAPALCNALAYHAVKEGIVTVTSTSETSEQETEEPPPQEDALILVRLAAAQTKLNVEDEAAMQSITEDFQTQLITRLRGLDGVFQIDSDHLAVLLPRTTAKGAHEVAQKIKHWVDALALKHPLASGSVHVSMGISTSKGADSAEDVLAKARIALKDSPQVTSPNPQLH